MDELWAILSTWTPWHTLIAIGLLVWWLLEWAWIISEEGAARRVASLRGDIFVNYRQSLRNGLDTFSDFIGDHWKDGPRDFSAWSHIACAGWATLYPILLLTIGWALLGSPGSLGELSAVPDSASKPLVLIALFVSLLGPMILTRLFASEWSFWAAIAINLAGAYGLVLLGAPIVAIVAAVSCGATLAGRDIAFAFGCAAVLSYALVALLSYALHVEDLLEAFVGSKNVRAVANGVAVLVSGTVVALTFLLLGIAADRSRKGWLMAVLLSIVLLLVPLAMPLLGGTLERQFTKVGGSATLFGSLVLVVALLPAINAPLDWLSLGISRFLIRKIADAKGWFWELLDNGIVGPPLELIVISIDLVLALVIALAVVVGTAFFVSLFDALYAISGGSNLYDVPSYVEAIRFNPGGPEYYWIYTMMFWTLVPTLVHSIVFTGAIVMIWLQPLGVASGIARLVERKSSLSRGLAALLLVLLRASPTLVLAVGSILWVPWLLSQFGWTPSDLGNGLADAAREAASAAVTLARQLVGP